MTAANQTRRNVMLTAWSFQRAEPDRPFAECLRGAWKWTKGMAKTAAEFRAKARSGARVDFSPSLIRSPIQRSLTGQRYAGLRDSQAAITTSRLGR